MDQQEDFKWNIYSKVLDDFHCFLKSNRTYRLCQIEKNIGGWATQDWTILIWTHLYHFILLVHRFHLCIQIQWFMQNKVCFRPMKSIWNTFNTFYSMYKMLYCLIKSRKHFTGEYFTCSEGSLSCHLNTRDPSLHNIIIFECVRNLNNINLPWNMLSFSQWADPFHFLFTKLCQPLPPLHIQLDYM